MIKNVGLDIVDFGAMWIVCVFVYFITCFLFLLLIFNS